MTRSAASAFALTDKNVPDGLAQLLNGGLLPTRQRRAPDRLRPGLDFKSLDALGLASLSPAEPLYRPQAPDIALEQRLAAALRLPEAVTFSSGTDAIRHTLGTLLQAGDEVLVDAVSDSAMFETVFTVGAALHRFPSGSVEAVERRLQRLSRQPRHGRLVIVVPAVSAYGSRVSDLGDLCDLARQHGALLVVDVSQDFGTMGLNGGGMLELQNCLGRADVVVGRFSRCFGMPGGFAAFRDPALRQATHRAPRLSSGAAGALLATAANLFSTPGRALRRNLLGVSLRLRNHLMADGARILGSASPFVPVLLPALTALPRTALLESAGPRVTLLMPPTVPQQAPRWRIELGARHSLSDIDDLAELIRDVSRAFDRQRPRPRVTA
jgi:7-keto-8-aminopelargonate synthetase-like enzyme